MARKGSEDGPWHEVSGGRIIGSAGYENDNGAGTPPMPGERGETFGRPVPTGLGKAPGSAGVYEHFRSRNKKGN
jgi:hypothetical protein